MKIVFGVSALVLACVVAVGCSERSEDAKPVATLATSLTAGGDQPRDEVLANVQASLEHYRATKSEAEAAAIDARFAGTVLAFDRMTGSLLQRAEPMLDQTEVLQGLEMAATQSLQTIAANGRTALGDLVWHAATHASTADDERRLGVLTAANGFSSSVYMTISMADGGVPTDGGSDAGITPDAGADAGGLHVVDWCEICAMPLPKAQTREEKLFKQACKAGLKALSRYADNGYGEDLYCPPPDCSIGREGWRGTISARDLLHGELSGSLTYGQACGRGILEVSVTGSGIGGSDPELGIAVSFGIRF